MSDPERGGANTQMLLLEWRQPSLLPFSLLLPLFLSILLLLVVQPLPFPATPVAVPLVPVAVLVPLPGPGSDKTNTTLILGATERPFALPITIRRERRGLSFLPCGVDAPRTKDRKYSLQRRSAHVT